jgi:two-component system, NtrC family, sensor kinase
MASEENRRVLIIDDNESIHVDFRKIIGCRTSPDAALDSAATALFGESSSPMLPLHVEYQIDSAHQGQEGLARVEQSIADGRRYALAFVDVRMPPGWDGIETVRKIWEIDNELQVVICTAYSDFSWSEIIQALGETDRLLVLKKPFDNIEVRQIASALVAKWNLMQAANRNLQDLKEMVSERTVELNASNRLLLQEIAKHKQSEETLRHRDEELRQAQKMEALGTLAGGVAHEFNNLLQSVQGYTRYAMEGLAADDPRTHDLEMVLKASERAAALTRQLLGFGRRQMLQFSDVDPNQMIEDLVKLIKPLIGEHIDLDLALAPNVRAIHADVSHLQQLLMNLCVNARDAMPSGGHLLIKTDNLTLDREHYAHFSDLEPGRYLMLTVSDTGCGMAPEVLQHAFEPFSTTKDVGKGTGLGLANVYGVVRQHKGTVRVSSTPGVGTTFNIYLPTVDHFVDDPSVVESSASRESHCHLGNREVILVAEDEESVRELTIRALNEAGYQTLAACDGVEALTAFEAHRDDISLTVLDVMMPRMNGREVYQHMKLLDPDVNAIFCSAYDLETAQLGFIAEQGLRFLQKPFDTATLLRVVHDVLEQQPPLAEMVH